MTQDKRPCLQAFVTVTLCVYPACSVHPNGGPEQRGRRWGEAPRAAALTPAPQPLSGRRASTIPHLQQGPGPRSVASTLWQVASCPVSQDRAQLLLLQTKR